MKPHVFYDTGENFIFPLQKTSSLPTELGDPLGARNNGILVPVRTSFGLRRRGGTMYQCKVDVDMLNAVKSVLADVSSVSPSSEQGSSIRSKPCETFTISCQKKNCVWTQPVRR